MKPVTLYNRLEEIRKLEEKFKENPETNEDKSLIREYSRLMSSMPNLISYEELRDYHGYLIEESEKEETEVQEALEAELENNI